MAKNKGQTFMFGAVILMISNIAVKLIGALLKIPLTNILGVNGMASYNAAYSIYVTFYTISTAGIPVAVSRMIATSNSKSNEAEIKKIFRVAFGLFFVIGLVGTGAMMIFSRQFATSAGMPDSYLAMMAIAPTIFFICLSSAYRGYFQGLQNMIPTAVSQVIESALKLGVGILCAIYFTNKGYAPHVTAAYVILGVTIGVLLGAVYGAVCKAMFTRSKEYKETYIDCKLESRSHKSLLRELIIIAIPITLASSIMGLTNLIDTMFMSNGLQSTGLSTYAAASYYGTYTSMVYPLFNLVPPFIYTFGISVIPAISASVATGNMLKVKKDVESAFRNCSIIAIPCAIGLGVLSKNVISFLYKNEIVYHDGIIDAASSSASNASFGIYSAVDGVLRSFTGLDMPRVNLQHAHIQKSYTLDLAAPALSVICIGILFLGVISITNSVLQAFRKERYTIVSTMSGIVVKGVVTYFVSRIPGIGVLGAAIGTVLCYFTIMAINLFLMIKCTRIVPKPTNIFVKPLISGVLCGAAAYLSSIGLEYLGLGSKITTLGAICVAAAVYLIALLSLKGLNRYDVLMMPKGEKLCRVLDRFNLLEKDRENE